MQKFSVKNWERFQQYKDRNPPWIKFHNSTLDDYAFRTLPDEAKAHLMCIWLLASRYKNVIPADPDFVRDMIGAKNTVDLDVLQRAGFIEPCDHDAAQRPIPWPSRYVSKALKEEVFRRDGNHCVFCTATEALELDHVIPISEGGQSQKDNLQVLCRSCNRKKRTRVANARQMIQNATQLAQQNVPSRAPVLSQETEAETETEGETEAETEAETDRGSNEPLSSGDDAPKNSTRENAELMMEMWNELASKNLCLPMVRKLTRLRITQATLRLKEIGGIKGWQEALGKIEISRHCLGDNDRGWVASFDFLLQPSSLTKLMEGNYDDRTPVSNDPFVLAALEERARRET